MDSHYGTYAHSLAPMHWPFLITAKTRKRLKADAHHLLSEANRGGYTHTPRR